jgi:hypothetical protein
MGKSALRILVKYHWLEWDRNQKEESRKGAARQSRNQNSKTDINRRGTEYAESPSFPHA